MIAIRRTDHVEPSARRPRALAAVVVLVAAALAGCGGATTSDGAEEPDPCLRAECGESGLADAGEPVRGGTLVYGLEGESSGGFCLPEAQLAISGMMVVRAIYDTLTVPNAQGDYVPYLAESVEPNDDYTEWTIVVRDGITFHDGSDLTGEVVKNNLDAYRGAYPARSPLLFSFVFADIESVEADGQSVTVHTKVPWVSFPAFLHQSNRLGIMAQAQLDDPVSCDRELIGTGPFAFDEWSPNDKLTATRNEDYWQVAPDGEPYPYADAIEFRPLPDVDVRVNSLRSDGGVNIAHTSRGETIGTSLVDLRDDGDVNLYASEVASEVSFLQLNVTTAPFDDPRMRRALAMGLDRDELNDRENGGILTIADGPFPPGTTGHLEDPGFPDHDLAGAQALVDEYVAEGGDAEFVLTSGSDPATVRYAELVQQRAERIGFDVSIAQGDQAANINDALGKRFQVMLFRNFPGGDPDANHVWWYGDGNPVNFSGYDDPDLNRLLDEGRREPDPEARAEIYEEINRIFAEEVYEVWTWYTTWAVAERPEVHGILGPPLPGDDPGAADDAGTDDPALQPSPGLATGHSLLGLWIAP